VFTGPQVASWSHVGLHLGFTDTDVLVRSALRASACGDLVVPRTRQRTGDGLSLLPHREHGTDCWQTRSCCDRQTHFGANWKHFSVSLFTGTKEQTGLLCGALSVYYWRRSTNTSVIVLLLLKWFRSITLLVLTLSYLLPDWALATC